MANPVLGTTGSNVSPIFIAKHVEQVELLDAPIPPSWIISGTPRARSGAIAHGADGWASSVVWECTAGSFRWQFGWEETVVILEGSVRVIAQTGEEKILKAGDAAFFAQGTSSVWHIDSYLKKVAFTRNRVPAYVRVPLSKLQAVRTDIRKVVGFFAQQNPTRKIVAMGVGVALVLMGFVVEL